MSPFKGRITMEQGKKDRFYSDFMVHHNMERDEYALVLKRAGSNQPPRHMRDRQGYLRDMNNTDIVRESDLPRLIKKYKDIISPPQFRDQQVTVLKSAFNNERRILTLLETGLEKIHDCRRAAEQKKILKKNLEKRRFEPFVR